MFLFLPLRLVLPPRFFLFSFLFNYSAFPFFLFPISIIYFSSRPSPLYLLIHHSSLGTAPLFKITMYFACFLQIFIFFKKITHLYETKLFKKLNNGIEFSCTKAALKQWIKTVYTQQLLDFLKFECYFEFLGQFTKKMMIILR